MAAEGVGLLAGGAGELATGADLAADGVGLLSFGAGELSDGGEELGDGLGQISGGMDELADGLGMAADEVPDLSAQEAEALGEALASPVDRPLMTLTGHAGPAVALALLLWLSAMLLQSIYPPAVAHLASSTQSGASLALSALWRPAAWAAAIGAAGGLILALLGRPAVAAALGLILFGAMAGAVFAAVHQALALIFRKGWVTASVAALVIGVSAALAPMGGSPLATVAGLLPAGEAGSVFSFLLVPGLPTATLSLLLLFLWGAFAVTLSVAATASKRKNPEVAGAAGAV